MIVIMGERHYTSGFSADSEQERSSIPQDKTERDPKRQDRIAFSQKYNIPELAQSTYQEVTGVETPIPTQLRQKLTNHLEGMFGDTKADEDVLEELIQEETERYIKMFAR